MTLETTPAEARIPLTRAALDSMGCDGKDCDHRHDDVLYFGARCHPGSPVQAGYHKDGGYLLVECRVCGRPVVRVGVTP